MINSKKYTKEQLKEFMNIILDGLDSDGEFTIEQFDVNINHNWAEIIDDSKALINSNIQIKLNLLNKCKK